MKQYKCNGFTLTELLIALLVLAIISVSAIPSFAGFIERQKLAAQAEAINSTLRVARTEALTRLAAVEVCWNQTNAAIIHRSFSLGPGQMAILTFDTPADVIRDIAFSDQGLFIDDTESDDCVTFSASGRLEIATVTDVPLAFGICKAFDDTTESKGVTMNATGRALTMDNSSGSISNCK